MYRMRSWSVRHARGLNRVYKGVESLLLTLHPLLKRIGYERLDKPFLVVEKVTKGFLLDSQNCGQCVVGYTGLSCPMNCPKLLRNGPCGGVRPDGKCEIESDMDCVWVLARSTRSRRPGDECPGRIGRFSPGSSGSSSNCIGSALIGRFRSHLILHIPQPGRVARQAVVHCRLDELNGIFA